MYSTLAPPATWDEAYEQFGRQYWEQLLRAHRSVSAAACAAHVNRTHLYKLLKQFNVRPIKHRAGTFGNLAWRQLTDEIHPVPGGGGQRLPVDKLLERRS
jgi:hypothetical protein